MVFDKSAENYKMVSMFANVKNHYCKEMKILSWPTLQQ